jgi:hypothetical protein
VGYVSLNVNQGPPVQRGSTCATAYNPVQVTTAEAYVTQGGAAPGIYQLSIYGCASTAPASEGISIILDDAHTPGTYTKGVVRYTDPMGSGWGYSNDFFQVTI